MKEILNIKYEKYKLENGLEVVLYQNKNLPIVSVNLWYKVGSANERKGKTGFAHLFEHMMFQGSQNVPKEAHFKYIREAGGTLNGSTSIDRTNYYETLPSNHLELALWLESDRMGYLLPALTQEKLDNQKDVVINERKQRYDNQPYGKAWEKLFNKLFSNNHPYGWPTIGWLEDIEKFELEDIRKFFKTYYTPNNASLVIGGDFAIDNAKQLVEKYFSDIKSNNKVHKIEVPKLNLDKNIFVKVEEKDIPLPKLYIAWHSVKLSNQDDAKLDILADILAGSKNSRLYKKLILEKQTSQSVTAFQYSGLHDGSFLTVCTGKKDKSLAEIKSYILDEINEIAQNGITEEELIRSVNSFKSSYIYSMQHLQNVVDHINSYNCYYNEPNYFSTDVKKYELIKPEDIKLMARKYLLNPYVELNYIPPK